MSLPVAVIVVIPPMVKTPLSVTTPPEINVKNPVAVEVKRSEASASFSSTSSPNTEIDPNLLVKEPFRSMLLAPALIVSRPETVTFPL